MSAQHTPGRIRYDYEPGYCGELIASNGITIATFTDEPSEADARRLVACWNLLAPFTTEQIEAFQADVLALAAQRDELLAALKRIADPRNTHFAGDAQVVARAAVAKVEQR